MGKNGRCHAHLSLIGSCLIAEKECNPSKLYSGKNYFQCPEKCILSEKSCDGVEDCTDRADEKNCGK